MATFEPPKPPGAVFVIRTFPAEGFVTAMPVPASKLIGLVEERGVPPTSTLRVTEDANEITPPPSSVMVIPAPSTDSEEPDSMLASH